ncbi:MAG: hypothetical protein BGO26_09300 [Actinobacteria bacterium 69-20]|nr:MAG: hypothetical protein BGO26_09300 [Actinobacteria bacterium 69-20]
MEEALHTTLKKFSVKELYFAVHANDLAGKQCRLDFPDLPLRRISRLWRQIGYIRVLVRESFERIECEVLE